MTEHEMLAAQKRADAIVDKVRDLITLESQVLEAREAATKDAAHPDGNGSLKDLEAKLETRVEELNGVADELKWATPCFRAYVLPQIGDIMGKQKSFDSEDLSFIRHASDAIRKGISLPVTARSVITVSRQGSNDHFGRGRITASISEY